MEGAARAAVLIASRALALPPHPLSPVPPPHTLQQIQNVVNDVATLAASDGGAVSVKLDAARGFALDAPVAEFEAVVRGPAEVEETGRAMFSQNFGEREEGRGEGRRVRGSLSRAICTLCPQPTHTPSSPRPSLRHGRLQRARHQGGHHVQMHLCVRRERGFFSFIFLLSSFFASSPPSLTKTKCKNNKTQCLQKNKNISFSFLL